MAKNFADRIRLNYPKTWQALTDGSLKAEVMAADGAPVMPKFVKELRKMPQFKHIEYVHDKGHSFNLLTRDAVNLTTRLAGTTASILTTISNLVSSSECLKKLYDLRFEADKEELDVYFKEYYCEKGEDGEYYDFVRHRHLKIRAKTRFLGYQIFYQSVTYLYMVTIAAMQDLAVTGTREQQGIALGVLRSLRSVDFNFELNFNQRYFYHMANCNRRLQAPGLTKAAAIDAYSNLIKELRSLEQRLPELETLAKKQTKEVIEKIGDVAVSTRHSTRHSDVDNFQVCLFEYVDAIEDTIKLVKESIDAETASTDDFILISSMYNETMFSTYTYLKSKYRKEMGETLLFLSMIGSASPRRLVQLDTEKLARLFMKNDAD